MSGINSLKPERSKSVNRSATIKKFLDFQSKWTKLIISDALLTELTKRLYTQFIGDAGEVPISEVVASLESGDVESKYNQTVKELMTITEENVETIITDKAKYKIYVDIARYELQREQAELAFKSRQYFPERYSEQDQGPKQVENANYDSFSGIGQKELTHGDASVSSSESEPEDGSTLVENSELQSPDQLSKREKKRMNAFNELTYTEQNYIDALEILLSVYKPSLQGVASTQEIDTIFFKIDKIIWRHKEFLKALTESKPDWPDLNKFSVSAVFANLVPVYEDYIAFIGNYSKTTLCINSCTKKYPQFVDIVEDKCLDNPINKRRYRIKDILIMPIQRVVRYVLLLETYLKGLLSTDKDYANVMKEMERLKDLSMRINEGQRYADSVFAVYDLGSRMTGEYETVEQDGRRLLFEDKVVDVYANEDSGRTWKHLLLFSDFILCARPKTISGNELEYQWEILLKDISRVELTEIPLNQGRIDELNAKVASLEKDIQVEAQKEREKRQGQLATPDESDSLSRKASYVDNKFTFTVGMGPSKLEELRIQVGIQKDLVSQHEHTVGIKLIVEGRKHRVFTCLFSSLEERDEFLRYYNEALKDIGNCRLTRHIHKDDGPVSSPFVKRKPNILSKIKSKTGIRKEQQLTWTGRLVVKLYGVVCNTAKKGEPLILSIQTSNKSGNLTSRARLHCVANTFATSLDAIQESHSLACEFKDVEQVIFTLTLKSTGKEIGACVLNLQLMEVHPRDVSLDMFQNNNSLMLNISYMAGL